MVIKFTYFDGMGRGEVTRMLLKIGGQDFVDNRIAIEDWPKIKDQQPFKRLPVVEIDGVVIAETRAIEQYFAGQFNLLGKNAIESALIMQFVLALDDVEYNSKLIFVTKDEEKQKPLYKIFINDHVIPFTKRIPQFLKQNGNGVLVGSSITYADIAYYQFLYNYRLRFDIPIDEDLKEYIDKVENEPSIKKHLSNRPTYAF
uniref:Glutathione S-transferase n=1 Tax=Rhabditophanes sp. KR3021 TaxID=114890 RepID=A0AC35UBY0_9BILA